VGAALVIWGQAAYGDDKPAPPACAAKLPVTPLEPLVQGASRCGTCHTAPKAPEGQGVPPLCRCNEQLIWQHNDKHQDAYAVLLGERAKRMNRLLNPQVAPEKDVSCLGCHSMYSVNAEGKGKVGAKVLEEGVSCIACHGAFDNWIDPHGSFNEEKRDCWRKLGRKSKEDHFGMTDLWDPEKRTKVCASCHVGDADPDKHRFVSHDMYAAGHPPLPAFETAAFCNGLPRHWELMNEKDPKLQDKAYGWDARGREQTKLVVVGGATVFRETMNLLAGRAEAAAKAESPEKGGLDFALFECAACHHDLRREQDKPGWRQKRGSGTALGRPGVRPWSSAVLGLGVWMAADKEDERQKLRDDLDARMAALRDAFKARSLGDPDSVAKAARSLSAWADEQILTRLNREPKQGDGGPVRFDKKTALALMELLARSAADLSGSQTPDYDAARQTAWAFLALYDDVRDAYKDAGDPEESRVGKGLQEKDSEIKAQLATLKAALNLELPNAGSKISDEEYPKDPMKIKDLTLLRRGQLEAFLPLVLKQTADYDPEKVQAAFAELAKLLP
jgi:hypothetical protein